jgi:predicted dehydrogenase
MKSSNPLPSRRDFLTDVAKAGAAASAFMIVPRHVLGRGYIAPSDKVDIGVIGAGGMGGQDVRGLAALPDVNIHSLCDVDWRYADSTFSAHPRAIRFKDFREMIDREGRNLDAITVSTPDHTHAIATMTALKAGKHVYTQKPLTRTIGEARALAQEAARRPRQITQMGNQGHANEGARQIREIYEAGLIGTISHVQFWTNRPIWPQGIWRPTDVHAPAATFDWNLWLGPAAERPYHPSYAPFNWRGWWDFGTGALGDMACHLMDAAYWTFGYRYPARISAESTQLFPETAPKSARIVYEFAARGARPPVTFLWSDGGLYPPKPADWGADRTWPFDNNGQLWIGDKGSMIAGTYGENPRLTDESKNVALKASPPAVKYPRTKGVYAEWIEGIKAGTQPGSNFGYAAPFTELILLGNLSLRLQRPVELNPETGEILTKGIPEEWIQPTYRSGWKLVA